MGPKRVELNLRLERPLYDEIVKCSNEMGFTTISEFIRLSLREALDRRLCKRCFSCLRVEEMREEGKE